MPSPQGRSYAAVCMSVCGWERVVGWEDDGGTWHRLGREDKLWHMCAITAPRKGRSRQVAVAEVGGCREWGRARLDMLPTMQEQFCREAPYPRQYPSAAVF